MLYVSWSPDRDHIFADHSQRLVANLLELTVADERIHEADLPGGVIELLPRLSARFALIVESTLRLVGKSVILALRHEIVSGRPRAHRGGSQHFTRWVAQNPSSANDADATG